MATVQLDASIATQPGITGVLPRCKGLQLRKMGLQVRKEYE